LSSIYQHQGHHDEPYAVLLGSRIRELRIRAGLTQTELGSPMTRSFVSAVEHGRAFPSLCALLLMSERLGVPVAVLLDELQWTRRDTYTLSRARDYPSPSDGR
jgi:transcriptional regulator with XRE-family HTH domain